MTSTQDNVKTFELQDGSLSARFSSVGASVMSLALPDSSGQLRDIVLGFDNPSEYLDKNSPYFGCVVGRVANRIADAKFTLDDVTYSLPANHGPNTLHGGPGGLHTHVWKAEESTRSVNSLTFKTTSPDGDQGFPGEVEFSVSYKLVNGTELVIVMEGRPVDKKTPISLAHHMYWNLGGHGRGTILDHEMQINGSDYTPVGPTLIPTGEILPTAGTPFDFSTPTQIGSRIESVEGGYDHNYVISSAPLDDKNATVKTVEGERLHRVATVKCPESGISMTVHASAPGVQFYSGNFLDGSVAGKGGTRYPKHAGFCLETQSFPNAVNEKKFPPVVMSPGGFYKHVMHIEFASK